MSLASDIRLARKANAYGARYALRIIREARRLPNVPVSLALAVVEQETNFANVFGHDPTIYAGAGRVTRQKYLDYKERRGVTGRGGMQGVGPMQLTWYSYQDKADRYGGCWKPKYNIRVGLELLSTLIAQYGRSEGIARYNGSRLAANRYSRMVRDKASVWHRRLV